MHLTEPIKKELGTLETWYVSEGLYPRLGLEVKGPIKLSATPNQIRHLEQQRQEVASEKITFLQSVGNLSFLDDFLLTSQKMLHGFDDDPDNALQDKLTRNMYDLLEDLDRLELPYNNKEEIHNAIQQIYRLVSHHTETPIDDNRHDEMTLRRIFTLIEVDAEKTLGHSINLLRINPYTADPQNASIRQHGFRWEFVFMPDTPSQAVDNAETYLSILAQRANEFGAHTYFEKPIDVRGKKRSGEVHASVSLFDTQPVIEKSFLVVDGRNKNGEKTNPINSLPENHSNLLGQCEETEIAALKRHILSAARNLWIILIPDNWLRNNPVHSYPQIFDDQNVRIVEINGKNANSRIELRVGDPGNLSGIATVILSAMKNFVISEKKYTDELAEYNTPTQSWNMNANHFLEHPKAVQNSLSSKSMV